MHEARAVEHMERHTDTNANTHKREVPLPSYSFGLQYVANAWSSALRPPFSAGGLSATHPAWAAAEAPGPQSSDAEAKDKKAPQAGPAASWLFWLTPL